MKKKIKVVLLLLWFIISLILSIILSFIFRDLLPLSILSSGVSLGLIITDEEVRESNIDILFKK